MSTKHLISLWILTLIAASGWAAPRDPRLAEAEKNQDQAAVRAALKEHVDVNIPLADGATALQWAAHWDDIDTVDALIRAGANVNAATDLGVTPLWLACSNGNAAIVGKLLAANANPNAVRSTGESPLMACARTGSLEAVQALLSKGASVNAKESVRGQTALMWAIAERHPQVARILIESGADVRARTTTYVLTEYSGDPALGAGYHAEMIKPHKKAGSTPLIFAAQQGDIDTAKLLLAKGADANDAMADGTSALVVATMNGQGKFAAFLLDKDANPDAAGSGYTAMHAAVLRHDLDLLKALLAHGANPNARLTDGTLSSREGRNWMLPGQDLGATPFWLAARYAEADTMRILAAGGADATAKLTDGTTPVMAAAGVGWLAGEDRRSMAVLRPITAEDEKQAYEAVKLAIELGGDVNAATETGETALHGAVGHGLNPVVQLLAENGAKLDVKDRRGQTPLMMTQERVGESIGLRHERSTAELLLKLGAKPLAPSSGRIVAVDQ